MLPSHLLNLLLSQLDNWEPSDSLSSLSKLDHGQDQKYFLPQNLDSYRSRTAAQPHRSLIYSQQS